MALNPDHLDLETAARLADLEPEALDLDLTPASPDLDPHAGEGEPLPAVGVTTPRSPLGDTVARLLVGRRLRRYAVAFTSPGRYAEFVEVLDPYAVGVVLARAFWEHGLAAARDADARLYLAAPDPAHGWRLIGRENGESASQAAVRVTLDAFRAEIPEDEEPEATRRYLAARDATRRLAESGAYGWTSWRDTVAREALERLADCREIDAADAYAPWRVSTPTGPRASTLAAEALAAEHLSTFLEYLPPGRHLSSTARAEYARAAALSGVPLPQRIGAHGLLDALDAADGVERRRTGSGRWVEVADPWADAEPAIPLDLATRSALARILDRRRGGDSARAGA